MKRIIPFVAVILLLVLGAISQVFLSRINPVKTPSVGTGVVAALGGLRSIASEVVWFRAERLQQQGRFGELVQLSSLLTFLEPHVPEVWLYAAWNLAYNVSLRMPRLEDRWRWVYVGIRLLRDEALFWNPGDPDVCYDLAYMFELKVGHTIDNASHLYRDEWSKIVSDVAKRGAWHELKMDPKEMALIERDHGVTDWSNPQASALYWALHGLPKADKSQRIRLEQIVRQSKMLYNKNKEKKTT